jgi:molybdate transport system substrate-binding protein
MFPAPCGSPHHMTPCADIKVLSSLATREAYLELVPQFERASGRKVETTWAGTVDIIKRISAGESFDLIIAANSTIDDFILPGGSKLPAGSIARTGIGIAVQRGAQRPDIGSAEALKRVLLPAKSVGYSTAPSGVYLAALLESRVLPAISRRSRAKYRSA